MKDNFGYFGSGLDGYVQYNESFQRNFNNVSVPDNMLGDDVSDIDPSKDSSLDDHPDIDIE